ncbi:MAG: efflux transporter outer membrane subunit, partial [Candidatus Electrothrix sp. GM3_4]|nr:efflux transporter outer membrane subunit [Candidatus Electrothrix sp. GM3_4]
QQKNGDASSDGLYSAGFDAAWELDLFGRVKHSREASAADLEATVESLHDVQVSLLAEVALNYLDVRSLQSRLRLAKGNTTLQGETYRLVQSLFDAGLTSGLELKEAESNLANTKSHIPPIKTGLSKAMHRLAVLSGQKPGMLDEFLTEPGPVPVAAPEIAIGIPADLMRRRPDIRQAERKLAAQSARIGVAVADLYPRFTLSGVLSFQATDASNLFSTLSRSLSFGPSFQWNIFNAGSVRNNITVQNERQKQALLDYEKSVLISIEEVENGMVAYAQELDRNQSLRQAVAASKEAVRLAESMYKDGLRDFNHVLTAQKSLFSQEDQLAESDAAISGNLIRLYKALGGGWNLI